MRKIKKILSIAGSDSGGGAGIQADIKTISALGHYAMTAVTAVTAQNTLGVSLIDSVSSEAVDAQLESVFSDLFPDAVKIGMLSTGDNCRVVARKLKSRNAAKIVLDTVLVSTSGSRLAAEDCVQAIKNELMPLADIITPNIPEAEAFTGIRITEQDDMAGAAYELSKMTDGAVLIKGGHLKGDASDLLYYNGRVKIFSCPRIDNPNTHGTGCTLSSAIACGLAEGMTIPEAVERAKEYITKIIGYGFDIGKGRGSLWHFG